MKYPRNVFYSPRGRPRIIPDEPRNREFFSLFFFFFSTFSLLCFLVYPPSGYRRTSLSSRTESFHGVQMVLIFMPRPLLVSREISVQFILMRVLKSDWTGRGAIRLAKPSQITQWRSVFLMEEKRVAESSAIYQEALLPTVRFQALWSSPRCSFSPCLPVIPCYERAYLYRVWIRRDTDERKRVERNYRIDRDDAVQIFMSGLVRLSFFQLNLTFGTQ